MPPSPLDLKGVRVVDTRFLGLADHRGRADLEAELVRNWSSLSTTCAVVVAAVHGLPSVAAGTGHNERRYSPRQATIRLLWG